ncbi:MAG: NAD(P)H-hydrate dehydratase, partial [Bacteroidota bacterium]
MKILSSSQIKEADRYTVENEPISSVDLMERAAEAFVKKFLTLFSKKRPVTIICGTGNNGGDGLAIGRILEHEGWNVSLYVVGGLDRGSDDFKINLGLASGYTHITTKNEFPSIIDKSVVIDGLFGSGLSKPIEGLAASLIDYLNEKDCIRLAIDIASGLYLDKPITSESVVFKPHYTISFQVPKLVFFQPSSLPYIGKWHVVDIGLIRSFIQKLDSNYYYTSERDISHLIPSRSKFDHKGSIGKLLLVAGSKGKIGASVLCAKAALRTGVGLLTVHSPSCGTFILQTSIPEAMVNEDTEGDSISDVPEFQGSIGIGPGIGTSEKALQALRNLLERVNQPVVFDADAINLLSKNRDLLEMIPAESILTPHVGEFKRLVGDWYDDFDKLDKLRELCQRYQLNMVLKGAYSAVCTSKGVVHFNSTGNVGMATGGSGDILT